MDNLHITSWIGLIGLVATGALAWVPAMAAVTATPALSRPIDTAAFRFPGIAGLIGAERLLGNLEALRTDINLSPEQKAQFDRSVAQTRTLAATMQSAEAMIRQTIDAELGKGQPNLNAIAAAGDALQAQVGAARKAVRADWIKFYYMLSAEQKAAFAARMENGPLRSGWIFLFCP
ncbi:MAG: Spy/CpxP family protein refolding chaperone [Burkholderiales bacterium]|nr:Spy/CpxP family protein refolding chaperone [Burkholderiales bacterium]